MQTGGIDFLWLFVRMIVILVVILGGSFAVIKYVLPRMSWYHKRRAGLITVVDSFKLEPRKSIYVVKVEEKYLLIGASEQGLSLLGEVSRDYVERQGTDLVS